MSHGRLLLAISALALLVHASQAGASVPFTTAAARDSEPVVLKGSAFGSWSVPANVTAKAPLTDLACHANSDPTSGDNCPHNGYAQPEVDTSSAQPSGTPVDKLLGYRWDDKHNRYEQVPFQVDEVFTRYLD